MDCVLQAVILNGMATKINRTQNHMLVFREGVPNSTWNTVTKTIEDEPLTSPQMGDIY